MIYFYKKICKIIHGNNKDIIDKKNVILDFENNR